MEIIFQAIFVFVLSLVFAFWEIEIEGKNGWAKKLPTWYRKSNFSKIFYNISSKKPLTGYHLFMLLFMLLIFHGLFFFGFPWTFLKEIEVLVSLSIFIMIEDFLWFQFNPYHGIKKFNKRDIWWHGNGKWFLGFFPLDYLKAIFIIIIVTLASAICYGEKIFFIQSLEFLLLIFILTILSIIFVKPYRRWYKKMRKIDESKEFERKIKF
ncbi:hypothetical protein J4412_01570 [Candidatus Pacearchaeota archaeon]|nr:MAG: hypothetical protein QJ16_C0003G0024 [archaeon GW2011_AR1]MBS3078176.1 hypothetical protein [Candidatus Pacearchaeota archaeon]HIH52266.1 hypothetical protein [Nanoarchaeota archaeon]